MGQDRVDISIARIERALSRIEAAAERRPADRSAADAAASEELRKAHQALRGKVESAIAELDGLLASGEQG